MTQLNTKLFTSFSQSASNLSISVLTALEPVMVDKVGLDVNCRLQNYCHQKNKIKWNIMSRIQT